MGPVAVEKAQEEKKEKEYRFRVMKLAVQASFQLVDEDGTIIEESTMQPIVMYPGKFISFPDLVKMLENKANAEKEDILKLANRPLL